MEQAILITIPKKEFEDLIKESLRSELANFNQTQEKNIEELLKPIEVANILKVSKVTLHKWTVQGKLTAYRIGRRKFYKRHEIIEALQSTQKYSR